jgi:hypothetical protein
MEGWPGVASMTSAVSWTDKAQVAIFGAQLVVLLAAAGIAWYQAREARRLREEQIRPFVVVDFDMEARNTNAYLEVSNLGSTLARDVRIEITPALESTLEGIEIGKLKMLNKGIATLAPGKVYRTFIDMGFRRDEAGLCMNFEATVSYADQDRRRRFEETLNLDLEQYMAIQFVQTRDIHDVHKQLESIRKVMDGWGWDSGKGLIAMSPGEARAEGERIATEMRDRRRRREGSDGEASSE